MSRLLARSVLCTLVVACSSVAQAQFGRGLERYRAQGTTSYQFGYSPTYEIVGVNASLQDLEFRLARYKNEIRQWAAPDAGWVVPAGTYGTLEVMALEMAGYFVTRRGIKIPVEPRLGRYYAAFVVDEELLRTYERSDEQGAVVIRGVGEGNPNVEKRRLTVKSAEYEKVLRELRLLGSARERPGPPGRFGVVKPGSIRLVTLGEISEALTEEEPNSTTGRRRQPGEELVTVEMTRAAGEVPAGARFTATIGHDLAHRTENGNLDGNGVVKLFTSRDEGVRLEFVVAGQGAADETTFTILPSEATRFRVPIR